MSHSHTSQPHAHSPGPGVAALPSLDAPAGCSGCACGHGSAQAGDGHDHGALPGWPRIAAALALAAGAEGAHWLQQDMAGMVLAVAAVALAGLGVYRSGLKDLARLRLGIHALMAVAVTGAFLIGQWPEAAMVMALYVAAERIEDGAMDRARHAIRGLLQLAPPTADVVQADGTTQRLPVAQVPLGATVRIAPGAHVPLDGTVTHGSSAVNQAPITGESQLADKAAGDPLYAGSVNQHGELLMRVTAEPAGTLLARIVRAVEQAQAGKAPIQRFVDRFAAVYTPIVFALAVLLALLAPPLMGWSWTQAVYQALALLVIACPCALVISTPVTVVSALTAAARRGILIKGGGVLESARGLRALALDKTGTLTTGSPTLVHWQALDGADAGAAASAAWQLASRSKHPVSRAIAAGLPAAGANGVQQLQALPGLGVQAEIGGWRWLLGNLRLMREQGLVDAALEDTLAQHERQGRSVTLLADGQGVRALFAVADPLRAQARQAMEQLRALGVHPVVLSGDNPATAQAIAAEAGIDDARGGLLPQDKQGALAALQRSHGPTAMAGDGINDAPALAQADLGFAMGGAHSTGMAMETAGVVLMNDDLRRIPDTVLLARRAHRVLWQNITLALGIKAAFCALALLGQASMWMAVAADMGVSLLVVANGLRLRRWSAVEK
ncbi:copper-translocating P-type ATPase [Alicycliphilus denitrificans]|uniref:heavy metal translocating P-type ATPase n=1 Tax=Alicycliphilus denitrificans TaxID=179636 RepID=UPI000961915D|nr:cation-translocating P-type ATPase [Alicycliphilus denitrificans]MBN9576299.1 cation-translocating P-type ATPase [Alicycliphilus denitrificans]OJW85023.1 MAG: 4-deoxy-4-formamido-L-arabinose-phospho-UDP deformylase [Alicycliphilus sp. 69-12]BCN38284.1 copper-translocating P-type ATPase [Alicycliphilus denitrificans]